MGRTTDELVQIASAGGGFTLDATAHTTQGLTEIASAASTSKCTIRILKCQSITTEDLLTIAYAGKGCVIFDL